MPKTYLKMSCKQYERGIIEIHNRLKSEIKSGIAFQIQNIDLINLTRHKAGIRILFFNKKDPINPVVKIFRRLYRKKAIMIFNSFFYSIFIQKTGKYEGFETFPCCDAPGFFNFSRSKDDFSYHHEHYPSQLEWKKSHPEAIS